MPQLSQCWHTRPDVAPVQHDNIIITTRRTQRLRVYPHQEVTHTMASATGIIDRQHQGVAIAICLDPIKVSDFEEIRTRYHIAPPLSCKRLIGVYQSSL